MLTGARLIVCVGTGIFVLASPAIAKDTIVTVDAKTMPWNPAANPGWAFNTQGGLPSKILFDGIRPGVTITLKAKGLTRTYGPDSSTYGPEGNFDACGIKGNFSYLPAAYIPKGRPCLNALVGAFITGDGTLVGRPFLIGSSRQIEVPARAAALSLGINDDNFDDNSGSLTVSIHTPDGKVTVEQSDGQ